MGAGDDDFDEVSPRSADFYPAGARASLEFRFSRKLILATRRWTTFIDGTLKAATGQNRARWQTLFAIAFADGPVTTLLLSAKLNVQWPTLVRSLAALEKDGLIRRRAHPSDGRSRLVELTDAGREMLGRIQPVMDATRAQVMADLTDQQIVDMIAHFDLVMERIAAMPKPEAVEDDED